jgi:hypothetical protein
MEIQWDDGKARIIREDPNRGILFEEVAEIIRNGEAKLHFKHPNQQKYPGQKIFLIKYKGYPVLVPYVDLEGEMESSLRTLFQTVVIKNT